MKDLFVSSTSDLYGADADTTTTGSKRVLSIPFYFTMDRRDIRSSLLRLGLLETTALHTYLVLLSRRSIKLVLHFPPDHNSKEGTVSNQSICGRGAIVIVELSRDTRALYQPLGTHKRTSLTCPAKIAMLVSSSFLPSPLHASC
jgi:hypothetical protein